MRFLCRLLIAATHLALPATSGAQDVRSAAADSVTIILRAKKSAPLEHAQVRLMRVGGAGPDFTQWESTDDSGRVTVPRPAVSEATLAIRAIGYVRQLHRIRFDTVRSPLRFSLVIDSIRLGDDEEVDARPAPGPVGPVRVSLSEPRFDPVKGLRPVVFELETVEQHGCSGHWIADSLEREGQRIRIELIGIGHPRGICATAMMPAHRQIAVKLDPGRYTLVFVARAEGKRDSLWLDVSDSTIKLTARHVSFVLPDEQPRWRIPTRILSVRCMGSPERIEVTCGEILDWIGRREGITAQRFGAAAINPFWGDTAKPHFRWSTFRVLDARAVDAIRECLKEVDRIFRTSPTWADLLVESWEGRVFWSSAWGQREPVRDDRVPRVTAGPACNRD